MKTINASASAVSAATIELAQAGQSPWLDSISRQLLGSGKLESLIRDYGLLGVTSNPTIFDKAISTPGGGYENDVRKLVGKGASTLEIYDNLTISDIQKACDLFREVHRISKGEHGFVSLEVRPDLAHDEKRTIAEAERLFKAVNRPNVMIKVPATPEGVSAFRELTALGINVNVTLIFSLKHYLDVANAYLEGLEVRLKKGGDLSRTHSVASVFVSRFDTLIDGQLTKLMEQESVEAERKDLQSLKSKAGVANSKLIYAEFKNILESPRFQALLARGATVQKVLWGSTSVKSPKLPDLLYVETLVGRETVNTMPQVTLDALIDHGKVRAGSVEENIDEARQDVERLREWGIDLIETGRKLQHDGLLAFMDSFDSLMRTLELAREARPVKLPADKTKYSIPKELLNSVPVRGMTADRFVERFFRRDASLWKTEEEHQKVILNRLGWIGIADSMLGRLYEIDALNDEVRKDGIKDIVLLGMGGSSLAPEVMSLICEHSRSPRFQILDTTDPASILNVEKKINLKKTLFIVASKSGSTIETQSQFRYFFEKTAKAYGKKAQAEVVGGHFVAITDEGSRLEHEAYEKHFRKVFINPTDIGGRYSALSFFGLVPAVLMGIPVREVLRQTRAFLKQAEEVKDAAKNPSFYLGALLGTLALHGRDKLTVWTSKSLSSFGAWLEQLIAESTGKEAKGILPVDGEKPGLPDAYENDRVFLVLRLKGDKDEALSAQVRNIKKKFPVIEMEWSSRNAIGVEFLRWEIITSIASVILQINPFDEPNVKESKDNTSRLLAEAEKEGKLAEPENLVKVRGEIPFEGFFSEIETNGYVSLLAYTERCGASARILARIQAAIRNAFQVPVTVGFGPRYLHSIGQFYKGGPSKGAFFVFITQGSKDVAIPHTKISFSQLKMAQAIGDSQAIGDRERPLLTIELGRDYLEGLELFSKKLTLFLKNRGRA